MTEVIVNTPETETDSKPSEDSPAEDVETATETKPVERTPEELEKLQGEVIRQMEYYFCDENLIRDRFLREQFTKDDGWVPFATLFTFKRLAALSTDAEFVASALDKSDEGLIEISEDRTKVRRHPERPVPEMNEEKRKEMSSRTAYTNGFPLDSEMSDLIEFFAPFEKVVNIIMRKYHDKPTKTYKFKGSVFVTFAKKEQCEEYVNKEKVEYKGTSLIRKMQQKYFEEKADENKSKKNKKKQASEPEIILPKGTVIHFEGGNDDTTREQVKEAIVALGGDVAYIEYTKGEKSGYVRFQEADSAKPFLEKVEDSKLKLADDNVLTLRSLTEEEEKEFLTRATEHMKTKRATQIKRKGGNFHGHKKRKVEASTEDEPPAKKDN